MREENKGAYRNAMDYTSRSGNLAGGGVFNSREQRRADQSFSVGGVPNNPRNADSQTGMMRWVAEMPRTNTYQDWRTTKSDVDFFETKPIPARYEMQAGAPGGLVNTLGDAPTTPLGMGLLPGEGPVSDPPNPIAMSPGISAGQGRTRAGHPGLGIGTPTPDSPQGLAQTAAPFQQMLAQYGTLVPGAMPPKPPGMA